MLTHTALTFSSGANTRPNTQSLMQGRDVVQCAQAQHAVTAAMGCTTHISRHHATDAFRCPKQDIKMRHDVCIGLGSRYYRPAAGNLPLAADVVTTLAAFMAGTFSQTHHPPQQRLPPTTMPSCKCAWKHSCVQPHKGKCSNFKRFPC